MAMRRAHTVAASERALRTRHASLGLYFMQEVDCAFLQQAWSGNQRL